MSLILPILIFAIFYFLIIRPKQAKLRAAQEAQQRVAEGDRVMTRSGIYGRVNRISQDLAVVEVAPGLELVFDRRSVIKAPESVDVEEQLSGESLSDTFSEDDFSQLHDHLESHQPEVDETQYENETVDGDKPFDLDEGAQSRADDDGSNHPGEDNQH